MKVFIPILAACLLAGCGSPPKPVARPSTVAIGRSIAAAHKHSSAAVEKITEGKAEAEKAKAAIADLAGKVAEPLRPAVQALIETLGRLQDALAKALDEAKQAKAETAKTITEKATLDKGIEDMAKGYSAALARAEKAEKELRPWTTFGHAVLVTMFGVAWGFIWRATAELDPSHLPFVGKFLAPYTVPLRVILATLGGLAIAGGLFQLITRIL